MDSKSTLLSMLVLVTLISTLVFAKPHSADGSVVAVSGVVNPVGDEGQVVPAVSFQTLKTTKLRRGRQYYGGYGGFPGYGGGLYPGGYGMGGGASSASASASASSSAGGIGYGGYPGMMYGR